jgi:outer membrane immunogenic protein
MMASLGFRQNWGYTMKQFLVAAAAVAALTGAAIAADIPAPAPHKAPAMVAAPRATWTGCYVGVGGGYGMWNQEHTTFDPIGAAYFPETTTGGRGYFGTVQGGCDYQISQFVIGVFGDYDFGSIKGTYNDPFYATRGSEKLKSMWAAGGRIGWLPYDTLLTFFSAGYTQAHFDQVNTVNLAGTGTVTLPSNTYGGWFLGSGYEYKFTFMPSLSWKTEYRFSSFSADRLLLSGTLIAPGDAVDSRKYVQTIRSELVWRFWSN